MRETEKYVWICSLIGFIAFIYLQMDYVDYQVKRFSGDESEADVKTREFLFRLYLNAFLSYLHHLVCAVWLFFAAKTENLTKPCWALFGLAFGVLGVGCFYAANVYFKFSRVLMVPKVREKGT